ncbi:DUF3416 domain-containing protein [Sesbania bispinosa]|nr:DUF3416 domain-containing protein [Sesbania bispinosa]
MAPFCELEPTPLSQRRRASSANSKQRVVREDELAGEDCHFCKLQTTRCRRRRPGRRRLPWTPHPSPPVVASVRSHPFLQTVCRRPTS